MNLICWLFGHDDTRQFDGKRVWCRCVRCGWDSPGLAHEKGGPRPRRVKYRTQHEIAHGATVVQMKARRRA